MSLSATWTGQNTAPQGNLPVPETLEILDFSTKDTENTN